MSAEAGDALRAAADLIERRGWVPHLGRGNGGPCCLVEAVTLVTIPSEALFDEATEALRQRLGSPSLAEWNDRQTHSGPVVALLRAAAEGPQQPTGQATQGPAGGTARPSPGQTGS